MKILLSGNIQLSDGACAALKSKGHELYIHPDERTPVEKPEVYEAVICNGLFLYTPIRAFQKLRIIQTTSAGLDRVPMEYIRTHGITLHNADKVYSIPVAEFALGGILQLYKKSRFFLENQVQGLWEKQRSIMELSGRSVCILGCGNVGHELAKRLKAFDCQIIGVNRTVRESRYFDVILSLHELRLAVEKCDILCCCIAHTAQTERIIDRNIFSALRTDGVFVNVARGAVVDEAALTDWLREGGSAVLDVFDKEPLPQSSPLWKMRNVILTPHNAFVSERNNDRMEMQILKGMGCEECFCSEELKQP